MTIGRARIVKSIAGALLLSLGVRYLWRNLYDVTSSYAVVSADSFSVASPIDGFVTYSNTAIGTIFASGQTLLQVDNTLVDKTQVAELEAQVVALDGEIEALRSIIGKLEGLGGQFSRRNRVYEERRGEQLAVLVSRAEAQVDADQAKYNEAQTRRSRAAKLAAAGVEPLQKSEEAERDVVVAERTLAASRYELDNLKMTMQSLRLGVSVSEFSSMDRAYSSQRVDDVNLQLTRLKGELAAKTASRAGATEELATRRTQLGKLSTAALKLDRRTRLKSVSSATGVFMTKGAALLTLIDCSRLYVKAYLTERQYARVRVGDAAEIRLRGADASYPGRIELLAGPLEVPPPATNALGLSAIVISSPALNSARADRCEPGQEAEVTVSSSNR